MANETQAAFDRLIFALQEFNAAAISARDSEDPSVLAAANALADAYTVYDDALYTQYGVETPLDTYDYDEHDEDYDDDLDDDHEEFDDDLDDDFDDRFEDYDDDDDDLEEFNLQD
ncbi:MAG: hypothetical protein MR522_00480 [Trueperella sp.]|uniref:hypothetical protein n=1 Tax=Trueperella TaxID=1069494 RepID=UPI0025FD4E5E|nr:MULTISPECIES: hypothetical protein [Trueperella]MCI7304734.1 hypothetical protein [Trueperella sp.]MDY5404296.1 hypothetical protein [Trueperella sp.]